MRLILILLFLPTALWAEEWWAWTTLDLWKEDAWSTGVFLANRLDLEDGAYLQLVSPRVKFQALPWLETSAGLSILSIEDTARHERYWQGRPELEINPKFNLNHQLRLEWRNRMEWRWNESESFTTSRTRHRLQLSYTLPHALGPLTRIFANNEWLVDLHQHAWTENRLVPLGVSFKITDHTDLELFYMRVSKDKGAHWEDESVLGTHLRIRF